MNINVGSFIPNSRYYPSGQNTKTTTGSTFATKEQSSITGQVPKWTAKDWDLFMEDLIKNYDDEKFAGQLQSSFAKAISTEKKINWQATGESELTPDQIDYLKSTYNIENMDGQDYYNLIADLTNMNVLSGRDTIKQHAGVMPIGVIVQSEHNVGEMADGTGDFLMFSGNIYQNVLGRSNGLSYTLNMLNNSEPFGTAKEYLDFKEYFAEQSDIYNKLMKVFDKIVH